jgi:hypothetical protein
MEAHLRLVGQIHNRMPAILEPIGTTAGWVFSILIRAISSSPIRLSR